MKIDPQYVTIASGYSVSNPFVVHNSAIIGAIFPVVTSGAMYLQAGMGPNSDSSFVRMYSSDGSGAYTIATGAGSMAAPLYDAAAPFSYARFESAVMQTDTRTITVFSRII